MPLNRARFAGWMLAVLAATVLAGCGAIGTPPKPVAFYDLGLADPLNLPAAMVPAQIEVGAPSWLDVGAMQYTLDQDRPQRRRSYAESRWVAKPSEMMERALARALRGGSEGVAEGGQACRLRIELDEFTQVFHDGGASSAELVLRASWLPARGSAPLARRAFQVTEPAPSADAEGGVIAHRAAMRRLTGEIAAWLAALDRRDGQGLNTAGHCGGKPS